MTPRIFSFSTNSKTNALKNALYQTATWKQDNTIFVSKLKKKNKLENNENRVLLCNSIIISFGKKTKMFRGHMSIMKC